MHSIFKLSPIGLSEASIQTSQLNSTMRWRVGTSTLELISASHPVMLSVYLKIIHNKSIFTMGKYNINQGFKNIIII